MTNLDHAFSNARGWYTEIEQLISQLDDRDHAEDAQRQIYEGPLSVLVRDGWRQPGQLSDEGACEYEILLSTGGPALRIYGRIGDHFEPQSAELQAQDWGTPWTPVPDCAEGILLAYAQQFCFE
jgi:hypothetical protein